MSRQKFSKGLKRQIAIEYMQSGKSRQEIALKYGLPNVTTLSSWVNTYLTPLKSATSVYLCLRLTNHPKKLWQRERKNR